MLVHSLDPGGRRAPQPPSRPREPQQASAPATSPKSKCFLGADPLSPHTAMLRPFWHLSKRSKPESLFYKYFTDICASRTSFACAKDQWRECTRRTSGQAAKMLPRPKHKSSPLALSISTRVIVKRGGVDAILLSTPRCV